jgi:hypothetical protein
MRRLNFDELVSDTSADESELLEYQSHLFVQRRRKFHDTPASISTSRNSSTTSLGSNNTFALLKTSASDIFKPRYSLATFDEFKKKLTENKKLVSTVKVDQIQKKVAAKKETNNNEIVIVRRSTRVRKNVKRLGIND